MSDIIIGKKSENNLESGYVFAPYIVQTTTTPIIIEGSSIKNERIRKISNIFELDIKDPIDNSFSPSLPISSRYSTVNISKNNFFNFNI